MKYAENNKKIAFIPANGILLKQDFTLHKMGLYFKNINNITIDLIYIKSETKIEKELEYFDNIKVLKSQDKILDFLKINSYHLIFHRAWMHRYTFASVIAENFSNSVIYIKDWFDEMPRNQYKFFYKTDEDYDAIKKIFKSNRYILSHYDKRYTNKQSSIYFGF